jgi:hypothetical protein
MGQEGSQPASALRWAARPEPAVNASSVSLARSPSSSPPHSLWTLNPLRGELSPSAGHLGNHRTPHRQASFASGRNSDRARERGLESARERGLDSNDPSHTSDSSLTGSPSTGVTGPIPEYRGNRALLEGREAEAATSPSHIPSAACYLRLFSGSACASDSNCGVRPSGCEWQGHGTRGQSRAPARGTHWLRVSNRPDSPHARYGARSFYLTARVQSLSSANHWHYAPLTWTLEAAMGPGSPCT